jgi:hypothetical protein
VGLCDVEVDWGRWLGPYRLRLMHSLRRGSEPRKYGTIGVLAGSATMHCRAFNGQDGFITVADVPNNVPPNRYDGWMLEVAEGERSFFERSHNGKVILIIDVGEAPKKGGC